MVKLTASITPTSIGDDYRAGNEEVTISVFAHEDDASAPRGVLEVDIDFGNGDTHTFPRSTETLNGTVNKTYIPGNYTITVTARNFAWPKPSVDVVTLQLEVEVDEATKDVTYLSGPILPADVGSPSRDEWMFDTSTNVKVLISSIKSALLTSTGERMMSPEYGGEIRRMLFSNVSEAEINQEVRRTIEMNEPRVDIIGTKVHLDGNVGSIDVSCVSRADRRTFHVRLNYAG